MQNGGLKNQGNGKTIGQKNLNEMSPPKERRGRHSDNCVTWEETSKNIRGNCRGKWNYGGPIQFGKNELVLS